MSVVIPVYKVESYIRQCLDSVILPEGQMAQLEVIVVNDGTPDQSADIARGYAEKYPDSIRVVDKENGGHGSALNVGLKLATGKYVRFLDSDDWLVNLSSFLTRISEVDADVIFTHLVKYCDNTQSEEVFRLVNVEYGKEYSSDDPYLANTGNFSSIYNFHRATYRTSMLQAELPLFCERCYYDDIILFVAPMMLARSVYFLDMNLYCYRIAREGQTIDKKVERLHARDYVKVSARLVEFVNNHKSISVSQEAQRDRILWIHTKKLSKLFASYSLREFKALMREWFPIMSVLPKIHNTRLAHLYNNNPPVISWLVIRHKQFSRWIFS